MLHNHAIKWSNKVCTGIICLFLLLFSYVACQPKSALAVQKIGNHGEQTIVTEVPAMSAEPSPFLPTELPDVSADPAPIMPPVASVEPTPTNLPVGTPSGIQSLKIFSLQVKQKKYKIHLSWKKMSGAASYQVYRKEADKKWKKYKKTKKKNVWIKYSSGKQYSLKVLAYNKKKQCIGESREYSFYIPKQPTQFHIVYQNQKTAKLSWKSVPRATSYLIYQKSGKGPARLIRQTKKCEYIHRNLSSNRSYQFQIHAVYRDGKRKFIGKAVKKSYDNHKIVSTSHQKYSYTEMANDILRLSRKYPGIVRYQVIGKSEDGRNLYEVTVGSRSAPRSILVVSTLHAREYMASLLCMNQIEYYARNYQEEIDSDKVSSILNRVCIRYIPMANPDGVTISQQGISQIRSQKLRKKLKKISKGVNTVRWKANARGVDLNDNFPYQFQVKGKAGSQGYSGIRAANSKEAGAIVRRIKALKGNNLKAVVNYHAMGSIIYGSSNGARSTSAAIGTERMYQTARKITGYSRAGGGGKTDSGGGLREYVMCDLGLPSITLEIGRHTCPGPISEFSRIWRENANLVLREAALFD